MPKHTDFHLIFEIYGLRLFHIGLKDIGLTMFLQDICLKIFIGLWAYGLRFFS
jgi:hypothetical protein